MLLRSLGLWLHIQSSVRSRWCLQPFFVCDLALECTRKMEGLLRTHLCCHQRQFSGLSPLQLACCSFSLAPCRIQTWIQPGVRWQAFATRLQRCRHLLPLHIPKGGSSNRHPARMLIQVYLASPGSMRRSCGVSADIKYGEIAVCRRFPAMPAGQAMLALLLG